MLLLWEAVLSLILLPSLKGDYTSSHLSQYLDHSIPACSDFHSHVCGAHMHPNQTVRHKSEQFYRLWAAKLNSRNRNNPIMDDIATARKIGACTFDASAYQRILNRRCGTDTNCYLEEFNYFFNIYKKNVKEFGYGFVYFAKYSQRKPNIPKLANVTSKLIEELIRKVGKDINFEENVSGYEILHDRLAIIRALDREKKTLIGLERIRKLQSSLKKIIGNRFKETEWLNDSEIYGVDLLSQFQIILEEMKLSIALDEKDLNIQNWRRINRVITSKYFEYSKRSTGCAQFDTVHPFLSMFDGVNGIEILLELPDWHASLIRLATGFKYNAFYESGSNSVILLAPFIFPLMNHKGSDTTMFAFAAGLAHEIYHPFIKNNIVNNGGAFNREYECFVKHFRGACNVWDQSDCKSGKRTFNEDGPDVEALRVAFELMMESYNDEQLQELEYEELGITRELFSMLTVCGTAVDLTWDGQHSSDKLRLNAMVSMMPEFTTAFGCQKGDAEYSEENSVCYLFGSKAGIEREQPENEEEKNEDHGEDCESDSNDHSEDEGNTTDQEISTAGNIKTMKPNEHTLDTELSGSGEEAERESETTSGDQEDRAANRSDEKNVENTVDGSGEEQIEEDLLS